MKIEERRINLNFINLNQLIIRATIEVFPSLRDIKELLLRLLIYFVYVFLGSSELSLSVIWKLIGNLFISVLILALANIVVDCHLKGLIIDIL